MKTLNLVNKEASDIKYQKLPFPDGQQNIVILPYEAIEVKAVSKGTDELLKYFDGIYCTNSYRSILTGEDYQFKQSIKQLNVF